MSLSVRCEPSREVGFAPYPRHTAPANAPLQHGGWIPFVDEERIQLTGKIIGLSIPCSIIGYAIEMYRGVSPFP